MHLVVLGKISQGLVTLSVSTDEATESVGIGGLVVLAGHGVNVGNIDLHTAEIIGSEDAVGVGAVKRMGEVEG